jgi:hypothetical protein
LFRHEWQAFLTYLGTYKVLSSLSFGAYPGTLPFFPLLVVN